MDKCFDLGDRAALITSAGHGIAHEIARALARAGADIVVAEFDAGTGRDAAKEMVYL